MTDSERDAARARGIACAFALMAGTLRFTEIVLGRVLRLRDWWYVGRNLIRERMYSHIIHRILRRRHRWCRPCREAQ